MKLRERIGLHLLGVPADESLIPDDDRYPAREANVSSLLPRQATADEVDGWMDAADERDLAIWRHIDIFLADLNKYYPVKVRQIRSDIKWLRHQAHKHDLDWGKDKRG